MPDAKNFRTPDEDEGKVRNRESGKYRSLYPDKQASHHKQIGFADNDDGNLFHETGKF
jgi:hypothetical protein